MGTDSHPITPLISNAMVAVQTAKAKLLMDHALVGSKTVTVAIADLNTVTASLIQALQMLKAEAA